MSRRPFPFPALARFAARNAACLSSGMWWSRAASGKLSVTTVAPQIPLAATEVLTAPELAGTGVVLVVTAEVVGAVEVVGVVPLVV